MDTGILLDGDFTRRLLQRRLGHLPSVPELETFCKSILILGEDLYKTYYYDCPPFDEKRPFLQNERKLFFERRFCSMLNEPIRNN